MHLSGRLALFLVHCVQALRVHDKGVRNKTNTKFNECKTENETHENNVAPGKIIISALIHVCICLHIVSHCLGS